MKLVSVLMCSAFVVLVSSSLLAFGRDVSEMRAQWEGVSDGIKEINALERAERSADALALTSTLVAWISSQSEGIVEEMEALATHNAESSTFSVVSYLRYLKLYDSLKVVARQPLTEFRWINMKAKVFARVYRAAIEVVFNYLADLDTALDKVEAAEPKGKAREVGKDWIELYESIRYIATHAPNESDLAKTATEMLKKSPNNTSDKMRSTRYQLKTHAFNR